jgi:hypothetical protein
VVWLPHILTAPGLWARQFFFMLHLKQSLPHEFLDNLEGVARNTIFVNTRVFMVMLAGLLVAWRKPTVRDLRFSLTLGLLALGTWSCLSVETLDEYCIHFWAVICLLLGLLTSDLVRFLNIRFSARRAFWIKNALFVAVIFPSVLQLHTRFINGFMLPLPTAREAAMHLLQDHVLRPDRVLAGPDYYFEVPATNKSVWYWSENLDLRAYDVLVARYPSKQAVPVYASQDQWLECLTLTQSNQFMENFELEAGQPGISAENSPFAGFDKLVKVMARKFGMSNSQPGPETVGCFIYRNKHVISGAP